MCVCLSLSLCMNASYFPQRRVLGEGQPLLRIQLHGIYNYKIIFICIHIYIYIYVSLSLSLCMHASFLFLLQRRVLGEGQPLLRIQLHGIYNYKIIFICIHTYIYIYIYIYLSVCTPLSFFFCSGVCWGRGNRCYGSSSTASCSERSPRSSRHSGDSLPLGLNAPTKSRCAYVEYREIDKNR